MMKFFIFSLFTFWTANVFADGVVGNGGNGGTAPAGPGGLNLKDLGFVLWGNHGEGNGHTDKTKCPLANLPENVFFHKTFMKGDVFFTWVKPVHGLVNGLTCGTFDVWKGLTGELLLDLHFFGNKNGEKFLHVEYLTGLGGVAHAFLGFANGATPGTGTVLGLGPFLVKVGNLLGGANDHAFLGFKGLPAFHFFHELGFHWGLGLGGLPGGAQAGAAA